ncbi:hypothetical protein CDO73_22405 [Saccharibacillus sp. O23]|uniref:hypothetical protein n=1 Tax=Saccharibacillus sp. O23 TaxID=2009338 RepID=UPI000B4E35F2|nr:hypothetical protein [Saccharibacillus sp. O23]OWR27376.1 hypothetical protein CDO73_22405 [Saccharibacillus sp. O23]
MIREGITKRAAVAAFAAALLITGTTSQASASEAEMSGTYAVVEGAVPAAVQTAAAETQTLRAANGEIVGEEASIANLLESNGAEGKGFSVFCISLAVSLALMLGIFGLTLRRKKHRGH